MKIYTLFYRPDQVLTSLIVKKWEGMAGPLATLELMAIVSFWKQSKPNAGAPRPISDQLKRIFPLIVVGKISDIKLSRDLSKTVAIKWVPKLIF